jgi:hypothetical protein
VEAVAVELGAEVPVAEGPVGEDAGLCVAEHPATATRTVLMIAAAPVTPGRDRLVMGGCPSLNPWIPIKGYGPAAAAVHLPGPSRGIAASSRGKHSRHALCVAIP